MMRKILILLVCSLASTNAYADSVSKVIEVTPTIDTSAYTTGDLIGTKLTLAGSGNESLGSGFIESVEITDLDKETVDIDVVIFDADPSGTTFTDNAAFDPADADLVNIVCVIPVTSHFDFNDNGVSIVKNVGCPYKLAVGSTSLYAALVSRASVTYTSAADLKLRVGIKQDKP